MGFENVAVPFRKWGNRDVILEETIHEKPWIRDFIAAFPHCFEYDQMRYFWVFYPEGNAPRT